jgi:hypothetical protein
MNKRGQEAGIVTSVGQLGKDHAASNERSYWNQPELYSDTKRLVSDWHLFQQESVDEKRRRAMMRTLITAEVLENVLDNNCLPIEAAIPAGDNFLVYVGRNVHQQVANITDASLPNFMPSLALPTGYKLDTSANIEDVTQLVDLWSQFGWTRGGVESFIEAGTTPIIVIRNLEQVVVGAMIAESLNFGNLLLVEMTEMAVAPTERGNGLASILIKELATLSNETFGQNSIIYGEYNITTGAHRAAARAGKISATSQRISGVLPDHVAIETGTGNAQIVQWETQWLHNFLVMHHLPLE